MRRQKQIFVHAVVRAGISSRCIYGLFTSEEVAERATFELALADKDNWHDWNVYPMLIDRLNLSDDCGFLCPENITFQLDHKIAIAIQKMSEGL